MANWKKVIVSGSAAQLTQLSVDTDVNISGSLNASGSVYLKALTNVAQATIVSIDAATGQLYYQGTGSFTANSASYAMTASYVNPLIQAVSVTGSVAITGSGNFLAVDSIYSGNGVTTPGNRILLDAANSGFGNAGDVVVYSTVNDVKIDALSGAVKLNGGVSGVQITGSLVVGAAGATGSFTGSFYGTGSIDGSFTGNASLTGSFTGSFAGDGSGLTNISASSIVGLQLNQIGSGSATASISPDKGFNVNTNTQITGSLIISSSAAVFSIEGNGFTQTQLSSNGALVLNPGSGGVGMAGVNQYITAGYIVGQTAGTQLTGSFSGSFTGVTNLPDLTGSTGIAAFTYDGSTEAAIAVSGASTLTTNIVTKWSGDAFVDSTITDSGVGVVINNPFGVLVEQGGLYVTGASVFHDNTIFQGNLTVQGTASFQNTIDFAVEDQFILLNSGSTTFQDSGFIINTGNTGNSGSAFFLETALTTQGTDSLNGRFAVAGNVQPNTTTVTAEEYAVTTMITGSAPSANVPQFGGTLLGQGNMWVDSGTGEIYIYA